MAKKKEEVEKVVEEKVVVGEDTHAADHVSNVKLGDSFEKAGKLGDSHA